ncbi:hypothetical protein N9383_04300 [Granulosicoccus sp.]|nr:hypothetical protein [Granulosicoccus sp.]
MTSELQLQMQEQISAQSSTIDRLQNQVSILEKATGRMHVKQSTLIEPALEMANELPALKSNAEIRLINLEKAVKQMHQRQRTLTTKVDGAGEPQAPDTSMSLRITNLEKAIKNLHLRSVAQKQSTNDDSLAELVGRLTSLEGASASIGPQLATRIATLEKRVDSMPADQASQLAKMEEQILRLSLNRPQGSSTTRYSQTARSSQIDIKRRVDIDIRLLRVERQLKRHESQLEDFNGAAREQELVVDQLMEMRGYIDTLLSEIYR